jgi:hypothetical protein
MLKRIVVIQFVALLSLALAGTSIADTKKPPPCDAKCAEDKKQADQIKGFQQVLESLHPQPTTGPKGAGSTPPQTKGRR